MEEQELLLYDIQDIVELQSLRADARDSGSWRKREHRSTGLRHHSSRSEMCPRNKIQWVTMRNLVAGRLGMLLNMCPTACEPRL